MCLHPDFAATLELIEQCGPDGEITCYKWLEYRFNELVSPFQYHRYKPGAIVSNRQSIIEDDRDIYCDCGCGIHDINRGVHVYLNREVAEIERDFYGGVVIEVRCKIADLIAIGSTSNKGPTDSAAFMKVEFTQEEYERVTNVSDKK